MKNENRKIDSRLGEYFTQLINASPYTRESLAEALGISVTMVNHYCRGRSAPEAKRLLRLLRLTGARIEDIPF